MIRDESVRKLCKEKVSGVLATVIAADGLGPAQQGDALFCADGKCLAGTVGGGENEQQVLKACVALNEKQKVVESRPPLSGLLHACGGTLQVRLDRLDLAREEDLHYFQKLCEPDTADRLLLFGAGHVVRELIWLADRTGFSSLVIDPRKELLPDSELPQTVSRICSPAIEWLADESVTAADRIIIAGPDHATDQASLPQNLCGGGRPSRNGNPPTDPGRVPRYRRSGNGRG